MKPENKHFLDEQFNHFMVLERAFYIRGLMVHVRERMATVMRDEFLPGFTTCSTCETDIANMVRQLYRFYHDWLRSQTGDTTQYMDITEGIIEMNLKLQGAKEVEALPEADQVPIKVHATFPNHKP